MNLFLRARHWQIFLLTFCLPIVLQIVLVGAIFYNIIRYHDPAAILGYLKFFPLVIILLMGGLFAWKWSVVTGLQKKIPAGINMKLMPFKIFFFIPMAYFILLSVYLSFLFGSDIIRDGQLNPAVFYAFPIIFPVHLFAMFCMFYTIYFVAKTIKTAELQREVGFNDFIGEFFLVWFHYIGIWILQPKINKMAEDNTGDSPGL